MFFKSSRADFLTASSVPFLTGAAYAYSEGFHISPEKFILGAAGVASMHLCANLLNDYYDYKSGADNKAEKISSFFGGSRAIQNGIYTGKQILGFSAVFFFAAMLCGVGIFIITENLVFIALVLGAAFLGVEYTAPPLKLSYRRLGEIVIFLLFGVLLVMGSFYLFSEEFNAGSFFISLPVSFLILAVILCNEIPDFSTDAASGKRNLHSFLGREKGYILYGGALALSFAALLLNIAAGLMPPAALFATFFYFPGMIAFIKLKRYFNLMPALIEASKLSVMQHALAGTAAAAVFML